jgi:nicotinamidase-related amidase
MSPLSLSPQTTALILIDLQHAVVSRQTAPHPAQAVVETCAALAARFRAKGALVVYVHVDLAHFRILPADAPSRDPNAPPPPPQASELVPEAGRQPGDLLITKRSWGAFEQTDLEHHLRQRGIQTIVLGGIATNFGVESTARTAAGLGFAVVFAEDAMTSLSADAHHFALQTIFPRLGRVRSADEITLDADRR